MSCPDSKSVADGLRFSSEAIKMLATVSLERMAEACATYAEWHGAVHDEDCPEDDTCSCSSKWVNDGVNMACRFLDALAKAKG